MSRSPLSQLTAADLDQLEAAGISVGEAGRQLTLLAEPPPPARLARPCTTADGIEELSNARQEELLARGEALREEGRLTKFVPASGAATRMFRELIKIRESHPGASYPELAGADDADARAAAAFVDALPLLGLSGALAERLGLDARELAERARVQPLEPILAALLDPSGLDAATLPKALLPFHAARGRWRTAFVEQLVEGVGYLRDRAGVARCHFTVPPGSTSRFAAELESARGLLLGRAELEVGFSEQARSTDTLALDPEGRPVRDSDGSLLLRPSGHGALLGNLESTGADLVAIKNIDNVLPEERHAEIARWKLILAGRLAELERELGDSNRPLRVCGVVPNAGEPGGGPFWVESSGGPARRQIVEASQVVLDDPGQLARFRASTHFNPVDLLVALRDPRGRPYRLAEFVDAAASFVSTRSLGGRTIRVLERPGLWNGAMAGWETRFVAVPLATFAPVKSVLDLARPEHAAPP